MALNESVLVEMPPHCVRARKNGAVYVQYTIRAYRNEKGKPTSDRVSIGKEDPATGKLIPNRNYYEYVKKEKSIALPAFIRSWGTYAAFSEISRKLGLVKLLEEHFGAERAKAMLTVAHYMMLRGNVMYYLSDFLDETVSFGGAELTGAGSGRLFSGITDSERICFFNDWMKQKKSTEYIAYDVTSISSYGKKMENLEWGYNRDKEKLPQINLEMYFGEKSRLPLYYRVYPGSIPDKAHLKHMTENNEVLSGRKTRFVMDRGFYSAENMQYLAQKGCRFIIALPGPIGTDPGRPCGNMRGLPEHMKFCTELVDKHREELVNQAECCLGKGKPYGRAYEVTENGYRMRVHLYYDPYKATAESERLYEEIERQENELSQMDQPPDRKLHYDRYFYINRTKNGGLAYRRNMEAINKALSRCGFFLIGETDFKKTTAEILEIYRRRDVVEKCFDNLKNDIDMRRLYVQSDEAARGKMFVAFIALIVRSYMQNRLNEYMNSHKYTFQKILLELDKVKLIHSANHENNCRLLNPPTKTQREIMEQLGLAPDVFSCV